MAATLEIKYFNTFLIKKIKNVVDSNNGSGPTPVSPYANVPADYANQPSNDWYIEESRVRGGYNNISVDFGVKAYLDESDPLQQHRFNTLIYSGVYNSRTGINNTNQFSIASDITRSLDPSQGSIQKLYAEDTNLIVFQEDKVSRALIDKDAIYSAEGNAAVTSSNLVIGQIVAYAGEYGISQDPFSFAVYGYRKYFTDRKRGAVLRLSRDGMTEISSYGMHDFFRDELSNIQVNKIVGAWDIHNKNYVISIKNNNIIAIASQAVYSGSSYIGPTNDPPSISVALSTTTDGILSGYEIYNASTGTFYGQTISDGTYGQLLSYTNVVNSINSGKFYFAGDLTLTIKVGLISKNETSGVSRGAVTSVVFNAGTSQTEVAAQGGGWGVNNNDIISFSTTSVVCELISTIASSVSLRFETTPFKTLSFDESVLGWTSFFTYRPTFMTGLNSSFYSFREGDVWVHNKGNYGNYYGIASDSNVTVVLNAQPSVVKNFKTINYEGGLNWELESMVASSGDQSLPITPFKTSQLTTLADLENNIFTLNFKRKENKFFANLQQNTTANTTPQFGEVLYGSDISGIKGFFSTVKFKLSNKDTVNQTIKRELFSVSSDTVESSY